MFTGEMMAETDKDELISIIEDNGKDEDIPSSLPLMPVRDVVIFTDMLLPLFVGREKSIKAVEEAVENDRYLLLVAQKDSSVESPKAAEIFKVGTVGKILRVLKLPDGRVKILVQGVSRAKVTRFAKTKPFYRVKIDFIEDEAVETVDLEIEALMRNVRENCEKIMALRGELTGDIGVVLESIVEPGKLADLVASNLRLKIDEAQKLLELTDPVARLTKANEFLSREVELSAMQAKIQSNVKDEISKTQRDYYLREQVRAIHKELGELDEKSSEITEYKEKNQKSQDVR
jgi:ATP-dependent Lon protease